MHLSALFIDYSAAQLLGRHRRQRKCRLPVACGNGGVYSERKHKKPGTTMNEVLWEVAGENSANIRALMETGGISRPTAVALSARGIGPDQVCNFLQPSLQNLVDPYLLGESEKAAKLLWEAIHAGEHILIHGDYDTDGITAAVLMATILNGNGGRAECFLPHRLDDGYGLTPESIDKACQDHHGLLVTVDCGITSLAAACEARRRGLKVIITDHHEPGAELPEVNALVATKIPGTHPQLHNLAGVGVAFKVCHAFLKYGREHGIGGFETDLRDVLDLVALGTVADIVPLLGENRCLVKYGLQVLSRQQRPGIRALCELAGVSDLLHSSDITFRLAPRLNAAGRMGDAAQAMNLLMTESMVDAFPLAEAVNQQNQQRQRFEEETLQHVLEKVSSEINVASSHSIVIWGEGWHPGVIGIVASRLVQRFHRPCIVLTHDSNGLLCGSGRSVAQVNLVNILEKCRARLTRFGGHPMAAGLTLVPAEAEEFRQQFETEVGILLEQKQIMPTLDICGEVNFGEISDHVLHELEQLEPYGHSNPAPLFIARLVYPEKVLSAGTKHSRGVLRDATGARLNFIAFGQCPVSLPPPPWDVAYVPQLNVFRGVAAPQARVLAVRTMVPTAPQAQVSTAAFRQPAEHGNSAFGDTLF